MIDPGTEASTNEYQIADREYADERQAARALARGTPPEEAKPEVIPVEEEVKEPVVEVPVVKEEPVDPLAKVPEDIRAEIAALLKAQKDEAEKLRHKIVSDDGRVSAYQKRYEDAQKEAAELKAAIAAKSKEAPKSLKDATTGRLKEAAEVDPALVETLDEVVSRMREENEKALAALREELNSATRPLVEARQVEEVSRFTTGMDTEYPNWRDIVYAKDETGKLATQKTEKGEVPLFSDQWAHFISDQPARVQEAIINIGSLDEARWAMKQHIKWLDENGFGKVDDEEAPAQVNIPNADAIQKKRDADLKKNAPPKTNQIPLAVVTPDNPTDDAAERRLRLKAREAIRKNNPSLYTNR